MHKPSIRTRRVASLGAAPVAVLLAASTLAGAAVLAFAAAREAAMSQEQVQGGRRLDDASSRLNEWTGVVGYAFVLPVIMLRMGRLFAASPAAGDRSDFPKRLTSKETPGSLARTSSAAESTARD